MSTKRLLIKASSTYDGDYKIIPVNTNRRIHIESDIGSFSLLVNIKNFDGSNPHLSNSLYNLGDKAFLNSEPVGDSVEPYDELTQDPPPNLRFEIDFKPKNSIKGNELVLGNDFQKPIKDHVPAPLLATGLKFFSWFINPTIKGDIYNDKPYLYGLALNSFSYIAINNPAKQKEQEQKAEEQKASDETTGSLLAPPSAKQHSNFKENLNENADNSLEIPDNSLARKKFFTKNSNCEEFVIHKDSSYKLRFDTNFVKLSDSKYAVSIPTYGSKTFDINVLSYSNDNLNNFNWVIKVGGMDGVGKGKLGLAINFALLNEKTEN